MPNASCCRFDCLIQDKRYMGNPDGCLCLVFFQRLSLFGINWESLNVLAVEEGCLQEYKSGEVTRGLTQNGV